jgi:hypothetical protein
MSKSFDAVGWMRKRREEIDREDEGLSWEERAKKTASILRDNPVWRRLKDRTIGARSRSSVGLPEE